VPGKPFSLAYKQKMVAQLIGRDAASARSVASEHGVSQATLSRWLREARSLPGMPPSKNKPTRSIDDKVRILAASAKSAGTAGPSGRVATDLPH
jgi:transposase-like protein